MSKTIVCIFYNSLTTFKNGTDIFEQKKEVKGRMPEMKNKTWLILIYFTAWIISGFVFIPDSLSQESGEINISSGIIDNTKNINIINSSYSLTNSKEADSLFESFKNYGNDTVNKQSSNSQKAGSQPDSSEIIQKNQIEYYEYKDWSWSMEFFAGYEFYTGELKSSFRDNVPVGLAFDLGYKDLVFDFRGNSGTGKTQKDLYINGRQWSEGENIESGLLEMTLGLKVFESRKIKITPFGGISFNFILPPEDDIENNPQLKDVGLESATTYTLGINLDYKLGGISFPFDSKTKIDRNYWYLRLRYGYNMPQFSQNYSGFSGNFHYITLGIGVWKRGVKERR